MAVWCHFMALERESSATFFFLLRWESHCAANRTYQDDTCVGVYANVCGNAPMSHVSPYIHTWSATSLTLTQILAYPQIGPNFLSAPQHANADVAWSWYFGWRFICFCLYQVSHEVFFFPLLYFLPNLSVASSCTWQDCPWTPEQHFKLCRSNVVAGRAITIKWQLSEPIREWPHRVGGRLSELSNSKI